MELVALPAFADSYIWMLHDGARALVVDPGDASVVEQALDAQRLQLAAILVTHHHADHVEPGNRDIVAHAGCESQRSHGRPTLPSTIDRERSINPFLRCTVPEVAASAGAHGASSSEPAAVSAALREWKNRF